MQLTLEGLQSLLIDLTNFIHVILGIAVVLVILIAFRAFPFHHDYSEIFSAVRYLGLQHLLAYAYSTTCILLRLPVSLVSVGSRRSSTTTMTNKQYAAYQQQTAAALDSIYHASNSELDSICLRDPITTSSSNGSNNYHSYYYVSGLVNTGNTCFLNSVLQVLSSLPRLQLYLEQIQPSRARPVSWFLATTLRRLNQPLLKRSSFKPVDIVSVVSGRRINSRDQQDAQELFQLITSAIDVEEEKLQSSMAASVMGGLKDILAPSSLSYKIHHRLKNPFTGLLASRLSCMQCGYTEAIRHFSFNNVQLTLPDTSSTTLDDCLNEFTAMEYLSDATCRKCALIDTVSSMSAQVDALNEQAKRIQDRASRRSVLSEMVMIEKRRRVLEHRLNVGNIQDDDDYSRNISSSSSSSNRGNAKSSSLRAVSRMSSKQVMFAKSPKILCLHLSRSTFHPSGAVFKNSCRIMFPEFLDLAPYSTNGTLNTQPHEPISAAAGTTPPSEDEEQEERGGGMECRYKLMGTIVHYGSHDFGHFIAYKRRLVAETCHCRQCNDRNNTLHGDENTWYRISDEQVDVCSIEEVLQSNPYMLLYEYVTPESDASSTPLSFPLPPPVSLLSSSISAKTTTTTTEEAIIETLRVSKNERQNISRQLPDGISQNDDTDDENDNSNDENNGFDVTTSELPAAPPSLQQGLPQCMPTRTVTRRSWAGRRRQSAPVITF